MQTELGSSGMHGLAGRLAGQGGAPISAYALLDSLPPAFATVLGAVGSPRASGKLTG